VFTPFGERNVFLSLIKNTLKGLNMSAMGNTRRYKSNNKNHDFQPNHKKIKKIKIFFTAQIHCAAAPNLCINKQNKKGGSQ